MRQQATESLEGNTAMARKHYHVYNGIGGGYIPNHMGMYSTLTAAREALRDEKEAFLDYAADSSEKMRVNGSIRDGYVELVDTDPASAFVRTAYIEACGEEDCSEEDYD
jgi:hypothetical protein